MRISLPLHLVNLVIVRVIIIADFLFQIIYFYKQYEMRGIE